MKLPKLRVARALRENLSDNAATNMAKNVGNNIGSAVRANSESLAPFISVLIIVGSLLLMVFCKMEARRAGYSVLKLTREERQMRDRERQITVHLAKITRPERLQAVAQSRLTLKKPEAGQIIQMTERGVALRQ